MATGDVTVSIDSTGEFFLLDVEGFSVGATVTLAGIALYVRSPGYDGTGTLIDVDRTITPGRVAQKAYPNQASVDQTDIGGALGGRVSLRDYIYDGDDALGDAPNAIDITADVPSGAIVNTAGAGQSSNVVSEGAVTNNSSLAYPKVGYQHFNLPYDLVTDDFTMRALVDHCHGVAAVFFSAIGASSEVDGAGLYQTSPVGYHFNEASDLWCEVYEQSVDDRFGV